MAEITYSLDFPHHEAPPTQEEFESLLISMSMWDLSFKEILDYVGEWGLFEACAYKTPLKWWPDDLEED